MRIKTAHIALLLAIVALAVSLFTAVQVSQDDTDALIDALMDQNRQLQEQIDALSGVQTPDVPGEVPTISGVTLSASTWEDGSGADVTLTLEGSADMEVLFRVMLGSSVIAEVPCRQDGEYLTATAAVPADNGYTYSMVAGSEAKTLASPDNPAYPELVYLADALSAYCNMVVGDWYVRDNTLTLENGYATIHTPQLAEGSQSCSTARLVLKYGEEVLSATPLFPTETDEPGSYACAVTGAVFALPELAEGEQVDLWLEATLSNGQTLTTCAATWYAMHSGFSMAAG